MTNAEDSERIVTELYTKDCQPCRYIGTATFLGIGYYILHATQGGYYVKRPRIQLCVRLLAVGWWFH